MARATVAVTGAGGLLGSAVTRRCAAAGARLRVLVGPPGFPDAGVVGAAERHHGWIDDPTTVSAVVGGAEVVVHLAGPPSVADSYRDPVGYARSHVVGTATVLEALARSGGRRLVHVSSAEVYGRPDANPVAEDHPTRPLSPYGALKLGAEALARSLAAAAGIEIVVLRPFSVYGDRSPARSLVGRLVRQAAAGGGALEVADLAPVRDYVHVDDVAEAVWAACRCPLPGGAAVFNVGSGTGRSVGDVAAAVAEAAGRDLPARAGPTLADRPPGTDITELVADIGAARRGLGWAPVVPLVDGLRAALRGFERSGVGGG